MNNLITISLALSVVMLSSGCINGVLEPIACTEDARLCPDGVTSVARVPPDCEFAPCPACNEGDIIKTECPDGTEYTSKSCDDRGVWHDVAYIRNPCEPAEEYIPNVGSNCTVHEDCRTPFEFLVQSNCPFASACIEDACKVICPLTYHDPDLNISLSHPFTCIADDDCNCTERIHSIECVCLEGECVSVEDD